MVQSCLFNEKARQIASDVGKSHFKGTNGWFEKWKGCYNIKHFSISGESGDVQGATVDSWLKKLLLEGYSEENIMN